MLRRGWLLSSKSQLATGEIQPTVCAFRHHSVALVLLELLQEHVRKGQPSERLISGDSATAELLAALQQFLVHFDAVEASLRFCEAVSLAPDQDIGLGKGSF